jgi:hypothetical protein
MEWVSTQGEIFTAHKKPKKQENNMADLQRRYLQKTLKQIGTLK